MKVDYKAPYIFACMALLTMSVQIKAHALKETTARIILRDGQIEIQLQTDIEVWKNRLQDNQAWLMGDLKTIMPSNLNHSEELKFLKNQLIAQTKLTVNGQALKLKTASFSKRNINNHHFTNIVLTTNHSQALISQLSIGFPKTLGEIHANFVQPEYRVIKPGQMSSLIFGTTNTEDLHTPHSHHENSASHLASHSSIQKPNKKHSH